MASQKRKKEKNLRPSKRENKRYLAVKNRGKVKDAILDYIGELGFAKASPQWVRGKENILAINREMINEVKAALELANIEISGVSGTLKGLGNG